MAYVAELRNTTSDKQLLQDAVDEIRRLVAQEFQVRLCVCDWVDTLVGVVVTRAAGRGCLVLPSKIVLTGTPSQTLHTH